MHKAGADVLREERVKQVEQGEKSVHEYDAYIPVGSVVTKLKNWVNQGAEIVYLSSHETIKDVEKDEVVLSRYNFPKGKVYFRQNSETYGDVVKRILPDVLIEDDCESIGGEPEMTYPNMEPESRQKVKSIVVKEFQGIDHLPDGIQNLFNYGRQ